MPRSYDRMCKGKLGLPDEESAQKLIPEYIQSLPEQLKGKCDINAYHCKFCLLWHIGRKWKKEQDHVCGKKIKHITKEEAGIHIAMLRERFHNPEDDFLNSYECPYCHNWHVGRKSKRFRNEEKE